MILYGMSSPNVRKVVIALEEMALPHERRHVAVWRARQFDPEFLSLNPLGKVPVLLDPAGPAGEEPIFESGAILLYLAEAHGPRFLPAAGPERYAALKWLFLQVASMGPALGNHSHFRLMHEDQPYAAGRFRRMAAQVYCALDRRLAEAPWLGGTAYSIADMAAWPWARYFHRHGMQDAECPHLVDWMDRIGDRPAVRRADAIMAEWGKLDLRDRAAASEAERQAFTGQHIPAPSAEAAAAGTPTSERSGR